MIWWQVEFEETGSFNAGNYRKHCGSITGYVFIVRLHMCFMIKPYFQYAWKSNNFIFFNLDFISVKWIFGNNLQ